MVNQQLLEYVRQQLTAGVSKEAIIKALAAGGWTEADVYQAINIINPLHTNTTPTPPPVAPISSQSIPAVSAAILTTSTVAVNTSGQGNTAPLPPEIRGWNWGAFGFTWIWSLANETYWGLLGLVPIVNFVMMIILGIKGNEWAWQNKHWDSIEQFKKTQRIWAIVWFILFLSTVVIIGAFILLPITFLRMNEHSSNTLSNFQIATTTTSSSTNTISPVASTTSPKVLKASSVTTMTTKKYNTDPNGYTNCAPNWGQTCYSAPNACGMTTKWTIDCTGDCRTAPVPSNSLCTK